LHTRFPWFKNDEVNSLCIILDPRYTMWRNLQGRG
jgi:hypothetical protein